MLGISAVILTKNEARNIKRCLATLDWVDEIVVIDDYSKDQTVGLAKKMGARVFLHPLKNNFAAQRNFALKKARFDWVFFVDADERVNPSLAGEIQKKIKKSLKKGYWIKRQDRLWGKKLRHGEVGHTWLLRLGRKNAGKWQRCVHEKWAVQGQTGKLKNSLFHFPHPTLADFLQEINFYSSLHAQAHRQTGKQGGLGRLVLMPVLKFIDGFFIKRGFLDGTPGLLVALLMSFHSFLAWSKLTLNE